ncbi:MAG: cyanophycinase [Planctomycetota bacterium]|jgi:cyanophycinase
MRSSVWVLTLLTLVGRPCAAQEDVGRSGGATGTLLLCGGGKLAPELLGTFHSLGGGDQGCLVLIPTASPRSDQGDYTPWLPLWQGYAWRELHVVHLQDREDAENPSHAKILRAATAVWMGGGDQSRLSERLAGTTMERELKALLDRGGALGGTSAGAAICSKVMIRDGKREPVLGTGFSILNDVIIDQHFGAKNRQERLSRATLLHPELAGLGIDEGTGILCRDGVLEVIGDGYVHWYRAGDAQAEAEHKADARWGAGERVEWSRVVAVAKSAQALP